MSPKHLQGLEKWFASLEPPRFPTASEIELWDFMYEIDLLDTGSRPRGGVPPIGGDALSIFANEQDEAPVVVVEV